MRTWRQSAVMAATILLATAIERPAAAERRVVFSGYTWRVKTSSGDRWGPGPNYFSDSPENVWVDEEGRLHLKITRRSERWHCAEVINTESLGYGTYSWTIEGPVDRFSHPSAVLGLFTYKSDLEEIDIEISRWGNPSSPNIQYVVQPFNRRGHRIRWELPPTAISTHRFEWLPDAALFESWQDFLDAAQDSVLLRRATIADGIPAAGDELPRINLWLYPGGDPASATQDEVEVIIRRFEFAPG